MTNEEIRPYLIEALVNGIKLTCDLEELEHALKYSLDEWDVIWTSPSEDLFGCVIHDSSLDPVFVARINIKESLMTFHTPHIDKITSDPDFALMIGTMFSKIFQTILDVQDNKVLIIKKEELYTGVEIETNIDEDDDDFAL